VCFVSSITYLSSDEAPEQTESSTDLLRDSIDHTYNLF
jgi:hypothetical protein